MIRVEALVVISDLETLEEYARAIHDNEESLVELRSSIHNYTPYMITGVWFNKDHVKISVLLDSGYPVTDTIDDNMFIGWYNEIKNKDQNN